MNKNIIKLKSKSNIIDFKTYFLEIAELDQSLYDYYLIVDNLDIPEGSRDAILWEYGLDQVEINYYDYLKEQKSKEYIKIQIQVPQ
jgi:glycyl-tRNA synthetase alpha subunit